MSRFSFHSDIITAQVVARHGRLEVGDKQFFPSPTVLFWKHFLFAEADCLGIQPEKNLPKNSQNYWETSWLRLPFFVCKTIFFVTQTVGMFSKLGPSPTPNLSGRFWEGWVELKRGGWVWDSQRWNCVSRWWVNKYFLEFSPGDDPI